MNWEFKSADTPPPVERGHMQTFAGLIKNARNGRYHVSPVVYLNRYPIEYYDCQCDEFNGS